MYFLNLSFPAGFIGEEPAFCRQQYNGFPARYRNDNLNKYSDDATTQVRNASHRQIPFRGSSREGNCRLNILRRKAGKVCKNLVYAVSASLQAVLLFAAWES